MACIKPHAYAFALVLFFLACLPSSARADCASPAGIEGETLYNTDFKTIQFCDGTSWIGMSGTAAVETDPQVGTLTNTKWCSTDGSVINCTEDAPGSATPAGTDGQIQFNESSALQADAALHWDNTNKRLGLGTASPSSGSLHVVNAAANGLAAFFEQTNATNSNGIQIDTATASSSDVALALRSNGGSNPLLFVRNDGRISVGIQSGAATALLDLTSTSKGFLPPRMDTTQRNTISSPATGLTIYNTTTNALEYYNGTAWTAGSGSAVDFEVGNTLLVGPITDHGITPTYTAAVPVTLPNGTWGVILNVYYVHGGAANHGYLSFVAYQEGTTEAEYKATYQAAHYNDYYNTDWVQLFVPWRTSLGSNNIKIEVTDSYNTSASNTYNIYYGGFLSGGGSGGGGSATAAGDGGQIQFNDGSDAFAADAALHWDNTNKRLGLGTASPTYQLHVTGTAFVSSQLRTPTISTNGAGNALTLDGADSGASGNAVVIKNRDATAGGNVLQLQDSASTPLLTVTDVGNVGIGTASPSYPLHISAANTAAALSGQANDVGALAIGSGSETGTNKRIFGIYRDGPFDDTTRVFSVNRDGMVAIGYPTAAHTASAVFEIASTSRGFLPPRMDTTQRNTIASPATGLTIYNTTTNQLEVYNGSAWVAGGGSATDLSFAAYKASAQTVATNADVKITGWTERFDSSGSFASDRFQPNVAGKYIITLSTYCADNTVWCLARIYKNGSLYAEGGSQQPVNIPNAVTVVDLNGTTDYIEGYVYNGGGTTLATTNTRFSGALITGGGGGGSATAAGSVAGAIQFNDGANAFAADDVNLVWDDTNNRLGIGTATPSTELEVTGTIKSSGPLWSAFGSTSTHRGILLENFDDSANTNGVDIAAKLGGTEFQGISWVQETAWTSASAAGAKDAMLQLGVLNDNTPTVRMVVKGDGNVGIGTATPAATALLDMTSTSRGFLPPRMTAAQRDAISSPAEGLTIYNTTTGGLEVYDGSAWVSMLGGEVSFIARGSTTSIPNAAWSEVVHATELRDAGGNNYNTTTGKFTAPSTGFYFFSGGLHFSGVTTGRIGIGIQVESATLSTSAICMVLTPASNAVAVSCSGSAYLTAGQVVEQVAYQESGSAQAIYSGYGHFSGFKLVAGSGGGGGATPAGTDGQIQFNESSALQADAALHWDNTNKRLGIGTAAPGAGLHISKTVAGDHVAMRIANAAADGYSTLWLSGVNTGLVAGGASAGAWTDQLALITNGAKPIVLAPNSVEKMRVDAAGNVGIGTASPAATALLDLTSTSKGFLPPRMTTTQRDAISSPATGLVVYNTTTNSLDLRLASSWVSFGGSMSGNTMFSGWADAITCTNSTARIVLHKTVNWTTGGTIARYSYIPSPANYFVEYDASGAVVATGSGITSSTYNDCDNETYATVVSSGRSFNFVGGATASADGSAGQVQFNEGGTLKADAALHWDNTNKRLGIGTVTPSNRVVVGDDIGATGVPNNTLVVGNGSGSSGLSAGQGNSDRLSLAWVYNATPANAYAQLTTVGAQALALQTGGTGNVGIGTTAPAATALLDISSTTKGFLPPRMTTVQRDAVSSPATGLIVYNTTTNSLDLRLASSWVSFGSAQTGDTMVSGWPDAIACYNGGNREVYYLQQYTASDVEYHRPESGATLKRLIYNTADGNYLSQSNNNTSLDCISNAWSISDLYTQDRAFNFVGGATASADGSAGQVQFNEGGNLKADAALHWDNTNKRLGIGTATPGVELHVDGTGELLRLTSSGYGTLYMGTDTNLPWFGTSTSHGLRLVTNGAERMRVDATGNVGIGTASPRQKLDVTGTVLAGDVSAANGVLALGINYTTADIVNTFGSHYSSIATTLGYAVRPKNGASGFVSSAGNSNFSKGALQLTGELVFSNAPAATVAVGSDVAMTERFRINASGNVGIGTATPGAKLDIQAADSSNAIYIRRTGGGIAHYLSIDGSGNGYMNLRNSAGTDIVSLKTNGNSYFTGGNVGIGTTSPDAKLTLLGNYNALLNVYRNADVTSVGAAAADLQFGALNGTTPTVSGSIMGVLNNPPTSGYLSFYTRTGGALSERMRITDTGNVGIGTTSPATNLQVGSGFGLPQIRLSGDSGTNDVDIATIGFERSGYNPGENAAAISFGRTTGGAEGDIRFKTQSAASSLTERMRVDKSGNVGIGTTSPSNPLTVIGGADNVSDSAFIAYTTVDNDVFSVLPWSGTTYLGTGVYYKNGAWVHDGYNAENALLGISGSNGGTWYASNNGSGSWNVASSVGLWNASGVLTGASSRSFKEGFKALDKESVLERIARLKIDEWKYRNEPGDIRHIGPVAEDWRAAFGTGADSKYIPIMDGIGVTLVGVQALRERNDRLSAKVIAQSRAIELLRTELESANDNHAVTIDELRAIVEEQGRQIERLNAGAP